MCLAIPAKIVQVQEDAQALVSLQGSMLGVSLALVPEAVVGDWVLVHAGFAIQRLDEKEAAEIWALVREMVPSGERGERLEGMGGEKSRLEGLGLAGLPESQPETSDDSIQAAKPQAPSLSSQASKPQASSLSSQVPSLPTNPHGGEHV